jgi:pyrroloquinoline-quinone synthase
MDTLARVDALIEGRHLLQHPFYTKWVAGQIPPTAIREYAHRYFHFEAAFPRVLSAIHTRTEDPADRAVILENMWDEEHGAENHVELWLRFAEGVGADRDEVRRGDATAATERLVTTYRTSAARSPEAGVAAVYAYESQVPAVAGAKIKGLIEHYGVDDDRTLAFWRVHERLDVEHADGERRLLERMAATSPGEVLEATGSALDAWWGFLDEVDEQAA